MNTASSPLSNEEELRKQIVSLLRGGEAHANFDKVISNFPSDCRGRRPDQVPYSAWQLLEHLRIAQRDILDYSTNRDGYGYKGLNWPADYWPNSAEPPSVADWEQSVALFRQDNLAMQKLILDGNASLTEPFPWGEGQNLLREALLVADHNAHHLGELILLRRLLGAWANA